MSLYHANAALPPHTRDDLQMALLHYATQFTAHTKQEFDEVEKIGSKEAPDHLQALATGAAAPAALPNTLQLHPEYKEKWIC